ncbi:MAG: hypothetical protein ACT4QD_19175 [Acidobacteriota bacterium]
MGLAVLACLASATVADARGQADASAARLDRTLRVFFDCRAGGCDQEFFRRELTWVDHVRDQHVADVHVLITGQPTGGGGTQYTVRIIGHGVWDGEEDTIVRTVQANSTDDQRRRALLQVFGLGLARFAARTPVGAGLSVASTTAAASAQTTPAADSWNYWVFRLSVNTFVNGEATSQSQSINANHSANRTTEEWKFNLGMGINYNTNDFTLSDGSTFTSIRKSWFTNALLVKSLGDHWSIGGRSGVSRSTFTNQQLAVRTAPALEYNVFPYSQSNHRQLTIQWSAGVNHFRYDRETLFGLLRETRFDEALVSQLSLRQPFGTVRITNELSHYFDDLGKHRIMVSVDNELRLTRGLSLNIDGNYAVLHDQIFLPRGSATDEEILVRQRQLATSYRYFFSIGVTYRFGSINNNVVNPRLGGPGGGFFF